MSPVHLADSTQDPILANEARFEKSHADHDPGEIVVMPERTPSNSRRMSWKLRYVWLSRK